MGFTTRTASVVPAPRPAAHVRSAFRRTQKDTLRRGDARLAVRKPVLVLLETHETNGHLGHNTRHDSTETLVQAEGALTADDVHTGGEEATRLLAVRAATAGKLHAHLDGVER